MSWQHNPLLYISLAGAIFAIVMVRFGWKKRRRPNASIFIAAQVLVAEVALAHVLQLSRNNLPSMLFASRAQLVGIVTIPILFLTAVAAPRVRGSKLALAPLVALCVVPLITLYFFLFAAVPNPMLNAARVVGSGRYAELALEPGPWFWVHSVYSYGLVLAGLVLVGERLLHVPTPYRRKPLLALAALFVVNLAHVGVNISMLEGRSSDLMTGLTVGMLSVALLVAFEYNVFDVAPKARDLVLKRLPIGVITLDAHENVLDANDAATEYLGIPLNRLVHRPAREALAAIPQLVEALDQDSLAVELDHERPSSPFEVTLMRIESRKGELEGAALIVRDMSPELAERARLQELVAHIPICAWCGQARTNEGSWEPLADWLRHQGGMILSHGICHDCRQHYEADPNWKPPSRKRPRGRGARPDKPNEPVS